MKKYQVPTIEITKTSPMLLQSGSPGGGTQGSGQQTNPTPTPGIGPNAAPWRY